MKIYNTLQKENVQVNSIDDNQIKIYSCGPTVYDEVHLGNLATFIYTDTLARAFRLNGYNVIHVMNITDIDDKTIRKSKSEYPNLKPIEALERTTRKYEKLFFDDLKKVNIHKNNYHIIRATESIDLIKSLINQIIKSGIAYIADDGIYFSIEKYIEAGNKYGVLSNLPLNHRDVKHRIDNDEYDKDTIEDFVLWKKQKESEPAWDYKINNINIKGRPGWHIECSAMSINKLGQPFDIHTGGIDLIFPHHENEIAQNKSINGLNLANYWLHTNHLLVDGKKISKSLGNGIGLAEIIELGYYPTSFRLLVLQSHYSNQSLFNYEILSDAQTSLSNLVRDFSWIYSVVNYKNSGIDIKNIIINAKKSISLAMDENLNTPSAISKLFEVSAIIGSIKSCDELEFNEIESFAEYIERLLGLKIINKIILDKNQLELIRERQSNRVHKKWLLADNIRDELLTMDVGLRDTEDATYWYPII